jgi:hypothetical protein
LVNLKNGGPFTEEEKKEIWFEEINAELEDIDRQVYPEDLMSTTKSQIAMCTLYSSLVGPLSRMSKTNLIDCPI